MYMYIQNLDGKDLWHTKIPISLWLLNQIGWGFAEMQIICYIFIFLKHINSKFLKLLMLKVRSSFLFLDNLYLPGLRMVMVTWTASLMRLSRANIQWGLMLCMCCLNTSFTCTERQNLKYFNLVQQEQNINCSVLKALFKGNVEYW